MAQGLYVIDQNVIDRANATELELSSQVTEGGILQEERKRLENFWFAVRICSADLKKVTFILGQQIAWYFLFRKHSG